IKTLIQKYNSDLLLQLQESNATEERIDYLCRFFIDQLAHIRTKPDQDLAYALQTIVQQAGRVSLKALQQELRISERTFERKFKSYVGVSPKLFTRICRFQSSLKQLRAGKYQKLSDIAFDNGYSDQSHFIRDFKRFSGHLPLQYQQANPLVENFSV
ncbi:MAG: helix-turn-helix transcriptional regulator, partial [Bacteroidota bacterium]